MFYMRLPKVVSLVSFSMGTTRDMTSSIDVRMAPSNGETPNYTSKERLGALYFIPIYGTLDYIFNVLDPG